MNSLAVATICMAFVFAFINGMHDGSNVTATIIASRSLEPKKALMIACIMEFAGGAILGTAVAKTVGTGVVYRESMLGADPEIAVVFVLGAIVGATVWNVLTWILALPSSSSHAIIGGLMGAGIVAFGWGSVVWKSVLIKVVLFMFLSPIIGFVVGFVVLWAITMLFRGRKRKTESVLRHVQRYSLAVLSLFYGSNDAQKSMGLIAMAIAMTAGVSTFDVPIWAKLGCAAALAIGTISGGLNMIRTIGMKIYRIQPTQSFACHITVIIVLGIATVIGAPISTTQLITATVMGVGSGTNARRINWPVFGKVIVSWFTTIPAAALVGAGTFWLLKSILL